MQQPCHYLATQLVPRLLLLGRAARRSLFLGLIAVVDINPLGYPLIHLTLVVHQDLTESLLGRLDQIAVAFGRLLVAVGLRVPNAMGARNKHQRVILVPFGQPCLSWRGDRPHGVIGNKRNHPIDSFVQSVPVDQKIGNSVKGVSNPDKDDLRGLIRFDIVVPKVSSQFLRLGRTVFIFVFVFVGYLAQITCLGIFTSMTA